MKNSGNKTSVRDTYTYTEVASEVEHLKKSDDDICKRIYTYQEALELTGNGRYNYLLLMTCSLITIACALDMFGYATVVAAASCDLNVNLKQLGILASAPFAGVLFAYPWGYYADTRGRKRAMLISTSVGFTLAMISAFSTHWLFMLVIKIIGCSFSTASFTLTMALLGECTGDRHRRQYLFIMNSLNLSSDVLAFGLAWLILPLDFKFPLPFLDTSFRPWRLYTIALALPLGIGTALLFCVYESPEFLACKGNSKKAVELLIRISERNGVKKENYPVRHIILTNSKTPKDESFWVNLKNQTLPIFKPPLLWRTVQLFFLLALCCVTNNAFTMWYPTMVNFFFKSFNTEDSTQQTFCHRMFGNTNSTDTTQTSECNDVISPNTMYAGILYGVFYWILSMAVVKVASRPRLLLIVVLLVSGVSMLLVNVKDPIANMVFFTLLQDTSLGIGCISSYFVDLYPVMHRGMVTSLGMMVARLSSLTGVTLVGTVITQYCEVTFYTWAAFVLGAVIVCLFLPADTKTNKSDVIQIPS